MHTNRQKEKKIGAILPIMLEKLGWKRKGVAEYTKLSNKSLNTFYKKSEENGKTL